MAESDSIRSAVLYSYAASLLKEVIGEDAKRVAMECQQQARSLISGLPLSTECKSPIELLVSYAIRIGREAATEEEFDNKYCGPNNEPILDVYRRGRSILDVVLSAEYENLTSGELESLKRLATQFDHRIQANHMP